MLLCVPTVARHVEQDLKTKHCLQFAFGTYGVACSAETVRRVVFMCIKSLVKYHKITPGVGVHGVCLLSVISCILSSLLR